MIYEDVMLIENDTLSHFLESNSTDLIMDKKDEIFETILKKHHFMEREKAEHSFQYKQIIPYLIIRSNGKYLMLKRTIQQTEKRLHNKYSLGIGGHINPSNQNKFKNVIEEGLYRELNEEIKLNAPYRIDFLGIINDETTNVGKVHLGLLYIIEIDTPDVQIIETHKMTGEWISKKDISKYYASFESWTQIVYDKYLVKIKGEDNA